MKKRFIAFLLVLIMVLGLLPTTAMAVSTGRRVYYKYVYNGQTYTGRNGKFLNGNEITAETLGWITLTSDARTYIPSSVKLPSTTIDHFMVGDKDTGLMEKKPGDRFQMSNQIYMIIYLSGGSTPVTEDPEATFRILYVNDKLQHVDFGDSIKYAFKCQYSTCKVNDAAHSILETDITKGRDQLKSKLASGYAFEGWIKYETYNRWQINSVNKFKSYGNSTTTIKTGDNDGLYFVAKCTHKRDSAGNCIEPSCNHSHTGSYACCPQAPTIPAPTDANIIGQNGIQVVCDTDTTTHVAYNPTVKSGTYTYTKVSDDTYTVTITADGMKTYAEEYSQNAASGLKEHTADTTKTASFTLKYVSGAWTATDKAVIHTTCTTTPPTDTTTVNVYVKPVDSAGNDIELAQFKSNDFGTNVVNKCYFVGSLTTTKTLNDAEAVGLEDTEPVKSLVLKMANGTDWTPQTGVDNPFGWASNILFTELKKQDDGSYDLYGQIIAYKLTLDAKGGTMTNDPSGYYLSGTEVTFPTPAKAGFEFVKWQEKDGSSTGDGGDGGDIDMGGGWTPPKLAPRRNSTGAALTKKIDSDQEWEAVWKSITPTASNIDSNMEIYVECTTNTTAHGRKIYNLIANSYTAGTITMDASGNQFCELMVKTTDYITEYNKTTNVTHTAAKNVIAIPMMWDTQDGKWRINKEGDAEPNVIKASCKPSKPPLNYSLVWVECENTTAGHPFNGKFKFGLYETNGANRFTVDTDAEGNEIVKDEATGKWTFTITLDRAKFVDAFSKNGNINSVHTDLYSDEVTKITWTWNSTEWKMSAEPVIKVTCVVTPTTQPTPEQIEALNLKVNVKCLNATGDETVKEYSVTAGDIVENSIGLVNSTPVSANFQIKPERFITLFNAETGFNTTHTKVWPAAALDWMVSYKNDGTLDYGAPINGNVEAGHSNDTIEVKHTPDIYLFVQPVDSGNNPLTGKNALNADTLTRAGFKASKFGGYNYSNKEWITVGKMTTALLLPTYQSETDITGTWLDAVKGALKTGTYTPHADAAGFNALTANVDWNSLKYLPASCSHYGYAGKSEGYHLDGALTFYNVMFAPGTNEAVGNMPDNKYDGVYDYYITNGIVNIPNTTPTRNGYTFLGWEVTDNSPSALSLTDAAATSSYKQPNDTYTVKYDNIVFTAQWAKKTYRIAGTVFFNGGKESKLDKTVSATGKYETPIDFAALRASAKTLVETYDAANEPSYVQLTITRATPKAAGTPITETGAQFGVGKYDAADTEYENLYWNDTTSYIWIYATTYYDVTFVDSVDTSTVYGVNKDVKWNTTTSALVVELTKTGYTFVGWYKDAACENPFNFATETITKATTLYAKWTPNKYTVKFDANKGTGAMVDQEFTYDVEQDLTANAFTRTGYTFTGWNTAADGTGKAFADKATVKNLTAVPNGAVTLYAQWKANTYTVTFNANGGKGTMDDQTFTYDVEQALTANAFTRTGYTFTGWNTKKDGSGTAYTDEQTVKNLTTEANVVVTLYAQWNINLYPFVFDSQDGSAVPTQTVAHGSTATKPADPTRSGYWFVGWYTDTTFTKLYDFSTPVTGPTTVYAGWTMIVLPSTITKKTPKLNTYDHFAYVQGYPDGTVKPEGNITRAETAAILFRLMDNSSRKTYLSTKSGFRDVTAGSWYNTYVATLNNAGVITDSANGYFRPNEAITRAELAAMLASFTETTRAANYFDDVSANHWAANAIAICAKLGWITGYPDGSFRPDRNVTRAELMAMINRATGRAPKSADAFLPGMKTWSDNTADKWYYLDVQEATNSHSYAVSHTELWTALTAAPDWSRYE